MKPHKKLKFASHLVPLILNGQKTATWRLFDDKNLSIGDTLDFYEQDSPKPFTTVRVVKVTEKPFSALTTKDKIGHESYANPEEMIASFRAYYSQPITLQTTVKVVHYKVIA